MAFLANYDRDLGTGYVRIRQTNARKVDQYSDLGISAWQSLALFPNWTSYSDLVYSRSATMLWELREAWGEKRVHHVLKAYVKEHQFGQARGNDVVQAFSDAVGADAAPYFDYWLNLRKDKEAKANAWKEKGKASFFFQ
jgi:hypothetical protein